MHGREKVILIKTKEENPFENTGTDLEWPH